jgi:hypothetical protein
MLHDLNSTHDVDFRNMRSEREKKDEIRKDMVPPQTVEMGYRGMMG